MTAAVAVIIIVYLLYRLGSLWALRWYPDERHYLPLRGDRHLVLHRFRAPEGSTRHHPAILCHGLGAHAPNLCLPGRYNLGERLRREGYDVWVIDLPGNGMSVPGNWRRRDRFDATFDDYALRDAPAAIDYVLRETGARRTFWVGHSMGGMVAYSVAAGASADKIRGAVAIASPANLDHLRLLRAIAFVDFLLKPLSRVHQVFLMRLLVPFVRFLPSFALRPVIKRENADIATIKTVAANVLADVPVKLLRQFGRWVREGRRTSDDGYDYQAALGDIRVPFLLLAGAGDVLAAPRSVEYAFERIASPDKTYHLFSTETGGLASYGHGDIMFGRHAPDEVFPRVVDWLDKRDA
ncbi:MAG: lysophospholipase [Deltaproteobacteria bacterium]|nr:lysophospholipase [Deltaproteobacteria bacterium]